MKACVLSDKNNINYTDIETPNINDDEVLIKIEACGICSSDFNRVWGDSAYFFPIVLGHEFSGKIVQQAESIKDKVINKRAVVFPLIPCNRCEFCKNKQYAQCKNYGYFGSRQNGAMAEYIAVPFWNIKFIPDNLSYTVAAMAEPMSVAINAVNKIKNIKEKRILISGTGTIAILCGLYAKQKGANVSFAVRNKNKKLFLEAIGFSNFMEQKAETSKRFDVSIECVGSNDSINNCIKFVKSRGEVILVGNPGGDICLDKKDYWKILRSEIIIKGVWNSNYKNKENDDWDYAIEFLSNNQEKISKLVTDKFDLKDGIIAFEEMKNDDRMHIKGVFTNEK